MTKSRQKFDAAFKAKVALEAWPASARSRRCRASTSPSSRGRLGPKTLWEHEGDRARRRAANARSDAEKVTLRRQIAEIVGGSKPSKVELRDAVRRTHAAEAGKPY